MITSITLLNRRPRPDTVDHAQAAGYLTYAGQVGHAMIDLELYLPKSSTSDPARCVAAGAPDDVAFATKAQVMVARALDTGVPAS